MSEPAILAYPRERDRRRKRIGNVLLMAGSA